MQTIDAGQLKLLIENKKAIIIDVREDFEYRNGHVPGAKNLPLSQLEEKYQEINWRTKTCLLGELARLY